MVIRVSQSGSHSPSTERNASLTAIKSKLYNVPPSRPTGSRFSTPTQQRPSPGRPRLSVSIPSKINNKVESRDDLSSHEEGETVCDYDTNATGLYELLESSSWDLARARCRSHPEEVRTWIIRKDKSLAVRWKLLPLHAAIIFQSPNYLVSALLEHYPAAVTRIDDQGMLPLHLAFRHKQEDEDLLELLLIKYPKAVMIKDRRDRVPLEHGRESKFSAKLMRLYADAVTAASRLVRGKDGGAPLTPSTVLSSASFSATERALLLKNHRAEIAEWKLKYETQLRKLKNVSGAQLHHIEEDSSKQIKQIRADYEAQIRDLKDAHERRLSAMRQSNQSNLHHVEQAAEESKSALLERHAEEVNELRALLNNQVNHDREVTDILEKEVAHLQVALQERRAESEQKAKMHDALQDDNKNLRHILSSIQSQQVTLHEMLARHQEDVQATRSIRNQLVQTLMRQDDGDNNAQAIIDMAHKIQRHVASSLLDVQMQKGNGEPKPQTKNHRGESRIERDRNALNNEHVPLSRLEQARRRDGMHEATNREPFETAKVQGDEISAMTECSDY
jgi:hypothetical protein